MCREDAVAFDWGVMGQELEERIVEHPGGQTFRWEAGEMLAPLTDRARAHAASPCYRRAADAVRDSVRFSLA